MSTDFPQEEKEQLIEYRSTVASLVGRAKSVVQLRPRSTDATLGSTTPIKAICDYKQIEVCYPRSTLLYGYAAARVSFLSERCF